MQIQLFLQFIIYQKPEHYHNLYFTNSAHVNITVNITVPMDSLVIPTSSYISCKIFTLQNWDKLHEFYYSPFSLDPFKNMKIFKTEF